MRTISSPFSLDDLLGQKGKWLDGSGPLSDIAVSSRIRLARNVDGVAFPRLASPDQLRQVEAKVKGAIEKGHKFHDIAIFSMEQLTLRDKQFLVERHLMSKEHAAAQVGRCVAIDANEQMSIMVNEEDHVRIQVMVSGLQLGSAWEVATALDNDLFASLPVAFSVQWGYLTYCPTNVGTAMRASVMLHLPALVFQQRVEKVLQSVTQLGLAVRGLYGESSEVRSVFFQLSNHVALGKSEGELIDHVERITKQVIEHEHDARRSLLKHSKAKIEDSVWRAYGLLKHARMLSSHEATDLLSMADEAGVSVVGSRASPHAIIAVGAALDVDHHRRGPVAVPPIDNLLEN